MKNTRNIWKIIYVNGGERYEDMIDHCSDTHNSSRCEIKAIWELSELVDGEEYNTTFCSCHILNSFLIYY